jgi:hypothetical protein
MRHFTEIKSELAQVSSVFILMVWTVPLVFLVSISSAKNELPR